MNNQIFQRRAIKTVVADALDFNLFTSLGSPTDPVEVIARITSSSYLGASSTGGYAFDTGSGWHPGSRLKLIIESGSCIEGKAGDGGVGGSAIYGDGSFDGFNSYVTPGGAGQDGGPALRAQFPIAIDNQSTISAGCGGGGGGGASMTTQDAATGPGGGGGGAQGFNPGSGGGPGAQDTPLAPSTHYFGAGTGNPGSKSAGGVGAGGGWAGNNATQASGGTGGNGGTWSSSNGVGGAGTYGNSPTNGVPLTSGPGTGGNPGAAVAGNSLITWINTGTRNGAIT